MDVFAFLGRFFAMPQRNKYKMNPCEVWCLIGVIYHKKGNVHFWRKPASSHDLHLLYIIGDLLSTHYVTPCSPVHHDTYYSLYSIVNVTQIGQ